MIIKKKIRKEDGKDSARNIKLSSFERSSRRAQSFLASMGVYRREICKRLVALISLRRRAFWQNDGHFTERERGRKEETSLAYRRCSLHFENGGSNALHRLADVSSGRDRTSNRHETR